MTLEMVTLPMFPWVVAVNVNVRVGGYREGLAAAAGDIGRAGADCAAAVYGDRNGKCACRKCRRDRMVGLHIGESIAFGGSCLASVNHHFSNAGTGIGYDGEGVIAPADDPDARRLGRRNHPAAGRHARHYSVRLACRSPRCFRYEVSVPVVLIYDEASVVEIDLYQLVAVIDVVGWVGCRGGI